MLVELRATTIIAVDVKLIEVTRVRNTRRQSAEILEDYPKLSLRNRVRLRSRITILRSISL
jgi:hypothetical protein